MSTPATLQHTVQIRPSRLAALIVAVAVLTGVATWSVSDATTHSQGTSSDSEHVSSTYVDGVTALTPAEQTAIYGNVPTNLERAAAVAALSSTELAAIFGNVPIDGTP